MKYVKVRLREKAKQVQQTTEAYVHSLGDEFPQELWTMLQFSLQHRVTYLLRSCTPKETKEMAAKVDCYTMEAVQVATSVSFETKEMARERLGLSARMKGGGMKNQMDMRYPAFVGALMDLLPRLIDRKADNGEITSGVYAAQMTDIIGEGAYDAGGHRNTQFLSATKAGPYPRAMQQAWTKIREETTSNYGIEESEGSDEWSTLGPLA